MTAAGKPGWGRRGEKTVCRQRKTNDGRGDKPERQTDAGETFMEEWRQTEWQLQIKRDKEKKKEEPREEEESGRRIKNRASWAETSDLRRRTEEKLLCWKTRGRPGKRGGGAKSPGEKLSSRTESCFYTCQTASSSSDSVSTENSHNTWCEAADDGDLTDRRRRRRRRRSSECSSSSQRGRRHWKAEEEELTHTGASWERLSLWRHQIFVFWFHRKPASMLAKFPPGRSPVSRAGGLLLPPLLLGLTVMMMMVQTASVDEVESEESQEILEEDEDVSTEMLVRNKQTHQCSCLQSWSASFLYVLYKNRNQLQRFTETWSNMNFNPESEAEPEFVQFW